jgi:molybdopterin molybdotransferase/putative molybdopterin biosynthesis protein
VKRRPPTRRSPARPAPPAEPPDSRIRAARVLRGLSQAELAEAAGLTRQAVYAIEGGRYLPNVATALRLGQILGRPVEQLFAAPPAGAALEVVLLDGRADAPSPRVKVWEVAGRTFALPVDRLGPELACATAADGLVVGAVRARGRTQSARVQLLQDERVVRQQVVVAGCDPAIHLVAERLRRQRDPASLLGWPMGSTAAVLALKRGEVHVAGLHVVDPRSGEANLPFVRRHLGGRAVTLVTFASWQAGLLIASGNPKGIRGTSDLGRRDLRVVNREPGAAARLLLDQRLAAGGIPARRVRGYADVVASHLEVGRRVAQGAADAGVGVESVARLLGLGFLPLQSERYDLVVPSELVEGHPGVARFLEALRSREVRAEIEALGGYSTRETGTVVSLLKRPKVK